MMKGAFIFATGATVGFIAGCTATAHFFFTAHLLEESSKNKRKFNLVPEGTE